MNRLWDDRLAEVWAWPGNAGSGVVVGARGVLTARHVIAEAIDETPGRLLARLVRRGEKPTSWVPVRIVASDPDWDLAVLEVDPAGGPEDSAWPVPPSLSPTLAAVGSAVEPGCEAVGFPDAEVQLGDSHGAGEWVRQSEQVFGVLAPMGHAKRPVTPGRGLPLEWMPLDISGATPHEQAGWGGMSGAGVLLPDGRLMGVVVEAQAEHQHRRLFVVPLASALASSPRLSDALTTVTGAAVVVESRHAPAVRIVRSVYLQQVEKIAPKVLEDRDAELAELAGFCTKVGRPRYVWWRAPAWAGKTALLSWFVLHPPPGVDVVSFFITARFRGQDTWTAFTQWVTEQLAELLGQSIPTYLTDLTREAHLSHVLNQAAKMCHDQGRRLILVVDGLDEDRGVTTGPDAHSIAALLPAQPPADMRIIVAGRLNPPIPADVPEDHPLRDQRTVRRLKPSEQAQVVKADAERELKRLLRGSEQEQSLLGLLTAAGGGLSCADLAELTHSLEWEIEDQLHAVSGRTFTARTGRWRPETMVYVLGHEELQQEAVRRLGPTRLDSYRQRLHTWADQYRGRHWPIGTPEYLLRGYFRLLLATDDLPRMLAYATDPDRQDRMLDITGGDSAALTDITAVQDFILGQENPDLVAMSRLAVHRDALTGRNADIPEDLPALWARLDHTTRAEALARSISKPDRQSQALAAVAEVVAGADPDRAETIAGAISDHDQQAKVLASVAEAVAGADPDRAEAIARSIKDPTWHPVALANIARAIAGTDPGRARMIAERADAIARSISDPAWHAVALTAVVRAVADTDAGWAETIAGAISPAWQTPALGVVARAVAMADPDRAEIFARSLTRRAIFGSSEGRALAAVVEVMAKTDPDRAEAIASSVEHPYWQAEVLAAVARAVANVDPDRAETIAGSITGPELQARALVSVAEVVAGADVARARRLAERAETLARSFTDPGRQAALLADAAKVVAGVDLDRARRLADRAAIVAGSIEGAYRQARALAGVAGAMAAADPGWARNLAERAESIARSIRDPFVQGEVALAVAGADPDWAETIADSITDPERQAWVLAGVARAVAGSDPGWARRLAEQAETIARSMRYDYRQARTLAHVAEALADADPDWAETIARSITDPDELDEQARVLIAIALAVADTDPHRAETIGRSITGRNEHDQQAQVLTAVARAVAATDPDRAERTAHSIDYKYQQGRALAGVAEVVAGADPDRAETIAGSITDLELQAPVLAYIARAVAATDPDRARNLVERAETMARSITDPRNRVKALTALAMEVQPVRARSLIAYALRTGTWRACLATLARIQPSAVTVIADEVLRIRARLGVL